MVHLNTKHQKEQRETIEIHRCQRTKTYLVQRNTKSEEQRRISQKCKISHLTTSLFSLVHGRVFLQAIDIPVGTYRVFLQAIDIPVGTSYAPLLADL